MATQALPNKDIYTHHSIDDLMRASLRLSDILAEETAHLKAMRVKELAPLQEEKAQLTKLLEDYRMLLASDPSFIAKASPAVREELLLVTDDLAITVEENLRHTAVARAVNQRVMQAITDTLSEQHGPATYSKSGVATSSPDFALSFNLNHTA